MRIADLCKNEFEHQLHHNGLSFYAGGFTVNVQSSVASIANGIRLLYGDNRLNEQAFSDFHIQLKATKGFRRWLRPRVQFFFNNQAPFFPMPLSQALPLMEWGLNWCVTNHCHQYLVIHAAVVEKNGKAIVFPGTPGSGKSTLCAALVSSHGWRLLSDELTIFDIQKQQIIPNPRPVSLKNESIEIIKQFSPEALFSPTVHDTIKGSVGHMKPSKYSVDEFETRVEPAFVVFPKYNIENNQGLATISKGESFLQLAEHSFNYQILQQEGFDGVSKIIDICDCYRYLYDGNLPQAIEQMESLVR